MAGGGGGRCQSVMAAVCRVWLWLPPLFFGPPCDDRSLSGSQSPLGLLSPSDLEGHPFGRLFPIACIPGATRERTFTISVRDLPTRARKTRALDLVFRFSSGEMERENEWRTKRRGKANVIHTVLCYVIMPACAT